MTFFFKAWAEERLWLARTMAGALEMVSRCPDVDEVLRFWAREAAKAVAPLGVGLFVIEGIRWLRILPETQALDMPFVTEATLSSVLGATEPLVIRAVARKDPETVLVRYAAPDGWRGVVALWTQRGSLASGHMRQASDLANAIARCLTTLRKSEMSREQAIALERSRWAAELHDGHLQSLSSAKLHAEICLSLEQEHEEFCLAFDQSALTSRLRSELTRLHEMLAETVREARQFLLELRSPPVSSDQFLPWLRAYADDFSRDNGIRVEMRVEGEGELPQSQVEEATRLIREALTNVRKHAKAGLVRIVVALSESGASISISDDGVGFDVRSTMEQLLDSSHNGLIGVRYRAESIGGEMRLRSAIGRGTTLIFRLPKTAKRPTEDSRRRRTTAATPLPRRQSPGVPTPAERETSVRDSIRATLADAITSFLEQEAETRAAQPGESES